MKQIITNARCGCIALILVVLALFSPESGRAEILRLNFDMTVTSLDNHMAADFLDLNVDDPISGFINFDADILKSDGQYDHLAYPDLLDAFITYSGGGSLADISSNPSISVVNGFVHSLFATDAAFDAVIEFTAPGNGRFVIGDVATGYNGFLVGALLGDFTVTTVPVPVPIPEPTTIILSALGLFFCFAIGRKSTAKK